MAFQLTLANIQSQFEDSVWESSNMLLALVAQDYGLDHKTLRDRYLPQKGVPLVKDGSNAPAPLLVKATEVKAQKKSRKTQEKKCCKGVTAKGKPCSFAAVIDGEWCKKHAPKEEGATAPAPKTKKPKAEKPKHNHPVEEAPNPEDMCQVCDTHGNIANPEAPREELEVRGAEEIKNRLADILKSASEGEDTEDEPEEEEPEMDIDILKQLVEETQEPEEETQETQMDLDLLKQLVEETQEETQEAETQNLIENDPEIADRLKAIMGDNLTDDEEDED